MVVAGCWWWRVVGGCRVCDVPIGGVQVGLDDREVGESLAGAPAAGGGLLDFLGADGAFGFIVCRWCEVGGELLDRVLEVSESGDEGVGLPGGWCVCPGCRCRLGERAVVADVDAVQNVGLEGLGGARAGLGGEVVGVEQGVGRRGRPRLAVGVGIGDRPQVPQRVGTASRVCGVGQVVVAGVAVADGHAGEGQYA